MSRIGPNDHGRDPARVDEDIARQTTRNRFGRRGDTLDLGGRGRDGGLGDGHHDPREQDARARLFESRLTARLGGGAARPGREEREPDGAGDGDHPTGSRGAARGDRISDLFAPVGERGHRRDEGGADRHDTREESPRVLAVAEPPADSLALLFAPASPPRGTGAGSDGAEASPGATAAERVAGIEAKVEQALQAELGAGTPQPITLAIPVEPALGLVGLSVTLGPEGLDIVLTRTGGPASEALVEAAASLAARLQRRFARQTVRVLETVVDPPAEPDGDLGGAPHPAA